MRLFKNKIARAAAFYARINQNNLTPTTISSSSPSSDPDPSLQKPEPKHQKIPLKRPSSRSCCVSEASRATKNLVKNYARAICSFAISHLAIPYLEVILEKETISLAQFTKYVKKIRATIHGLFHFRATLMVSQDDNEEIAGAKRVFSAIGEVFIKYFSVNWIFNSRVFHKEAHVKFRNKMLRRIRNPEMFTYLN